MRNDTDLLLVPFRWNERGIDSVVDTAGGRNRAWFLATAGVTTNLRLGPRLSHDDFPISHVAFIDDGVLFGDVNDRRILAYYAAAARATIGAGGAIVVPGHGSSGDAFNIYTTAGVKRDASMLAKAIVKMIELSDWDAHQTVVNVNLEMCFATTPHMKHGVQEFVHGTLSGHKVKRKMEMTGRGLKQTTKLTIKDGLGIKTELLSSAIVGPHASSSYGQHVVNSDRYGWSFAEKLSWIANKTYRVEVRGTPVFFRRGDDVSGDNPVQPKVTEN